MTREEFDIITDPQTRRLIDENIDEDPARLALSLRYAGDTVRAVCGQVKYLGRCRSKLPSYYAARCVIPALSYEQSSSEASASAKGYSGGLCIDLTCGLGVDTMELSKHFDRVIAVERDEVLAKVAEHNFKLLGINNVDVKKSTAEDFLKDYSGPTADLIYVDPARRGDHNRKVFLIGDCSPDVLEIAPLMLRNAEKVLIKLSPLFDVEEALRVFFPYVSKLETVSVGNECKELLVELANKPPEEPAVCIKPSDNGTYIFRPSDIGMRLPRIDGNGLEGKKYLLIPDAAFYKNRLSAALFARYFPEHAVYLPSRDGYAYSSTPPYDFPGRLFFISEVMEYHPKAVKKRLKELGVKRLNIYKRGFSYTVEDIRRSLSVSEGGDVCAAFTEIDGKSYMFLIVSD